MRSSTVLGSMTAGGEIRSLSANAREVFGVIPKALEGRPITHLVHEDDTFMLALAGKRLTRGRETAHVYLEARDGSGRYVLTRAKLRARFGEDGPIVYEFTLTPVKKRPIRSAQAKARGARLTLGSIGA